MNRQCQNRPRDCSEKWRSGAALLLLLLIANGRTLKNLMQWLVAMPR